MAGKATRTTASFTNRQVRKAGLDFLEKCLQDGTTTDYQLMLMAEKNKTLFEKVDELGDAEFVRVMDDWSVNQQEVYAAFWWWRKAFEDKAAVKSDDEGKSRIKARTFHIVQHLAPTKVTKPDGTVVWNMDEWEADRLNLKPGVKPLIDEQQIKTALLHKTIKKYAYIEHTRDIYTEQDEITDRYGLIKAYERKFAHWHVVIECSPAQTLDTIARWFKVEPEYIEIVRGRGSFLDTVQYLVHETPKSMEQGKTHYEYDEVEYEGFDLPTDLAQLAERRARGRRGEAPQTPAEMLQLHVLEDGWSLKEAEEYDPLTFAKTMTLLQRLRVRYLEKQKPPALRINFYIEGYPSAGKNQVCNALAKELSGCELDDDAFFHVGLTDEVLFDGYDGQPVIIWDDFRGQNFVGKFGRATFRLLDSHPEKISANIKYGRAPMVQAYNIVNGVQPFEDFMAALVSAYTDKYGNELEDESHYDDQAFRRFPFFISLQPDEVIFNVNRGFMLNRAEFFKIYDEECRIRGNFGTLGQNTTGRAKALVQQKMLAPIVEKVEQVHEMEAKLIEDPNELPEEFRHYGEFRRTSEIEEAKLKEKLQEEADLAGEYAARYLSLLRELELYEMKGLVTLQREVGIDPRGVMVRTVDGKVEVFSLEQWAMFEDDQRDEVVRQTTIEVRALREADTPLFEYDEMSGVVYEIP